MYPNIMAELYHENFILVVCDVEYLVLIRRTSMIHIIFNYFFYALPAISAWLQTMQRHFVRVSLFSSEILFALVRDALVAHVLPLLVVFPRAPGKVKINKNIKKTIHWSSYDETAINEQSKSLQDQSPFLLYLLEHTSYKYFRKYIVRTNYHILHESYKRLEIVTSDLYAGWFIKSGKLM